MAQDDVTQPGEAEGQAGPPRRRRSRLRSGISLTVILLVVALLAALWGGIRWLDSEGGHRFILQKIAQWQPDSGLRITVGSIEGRIFNDMILRDVRFFDRKGQFASVDQADVSWYPMGWLSNRLDLDRLRIHSADLTRILTSALPICGLTASPWGQRCWAKRMSSARLAMPISDRDAPSYPCSPLHPAAGMWCGLNSTAGPTIAASTSTPSWSVRRVVSSRVRWMPISPWPFAFGAMATGVVGRAASPR